MPSEQEIQQNLPLYIVAIHTKRTLPTPADITHFWWRDGLGIVLLPGRQATLDEMIDIVRNNPVYVSSQDPKNPDKSSRVRIVENGKQRIHLKTERDHNLRDNLFALPQRNPQ